MGWRWISIAAALASLVALYGVLTRRGDDDATAAAAPPSPGFFLKDAVITQTHPDGSLGVKLVARRIEQQRRDDSFRMQDVRVDYTRSEQQPLVLTSDEGFMPPDPRVLEFRGNVHIRPADDSSVDYLRTDSLFVDTERDLAYSNVSPTQVRFGQYAMTVRSFQFDLKTEKASWQQVRGRVEHNAPTDGAPGTGRDRNGRKSSPRKPAGAG